MNCRTWLVLLIGMVVISSHESVRAGEVIRFSKEGGYSDNFQPLPDVTLFRYDGGALLAKASKTFYGGAIYEPSGQKELFESGSVEAEFAFEGELGIQTLFYLVARYNADNGTAVLGRIIVPEPNRIRLQIFLNADPCAPPKEQTPVTLIDWEYDVKSGGSGAYREGLNKAGCFGQPGRTMEVGESLTVRLEQKEHPVRAFSLTLLDESGKVIGTTGFQSHEGLARVANSGFVGMGAYVAPTDGVRINSFTATP